MSNIHPLIVHFPIALIIVVFILDLLGAMSRQKSLVSAANILSIFAALGAVAAVVTGLIAEESVWRTEQAGELIELHETIGFAVLGVALVSLIFRPAIKKKKSKSSLLWVAVVISLAAAVLVGYEGYLGGEMVYLHGAGVEKARIETARADSLSALVEEYKAEKLEMEKEKLDNHDN
ncbi:MAG: DUF2231 domain-containing protein [Candidatus Zixiibacteriota bacterium]|nr:MAG: DUF2231 domain-containing protein [candidate division Zixibacteria bacterium]